MELGIHLFRFAVHHVKNLDLSTGLRTRIALRPHINSSQAMQWRWASSTSRPFLSSVDENTRVEQRRKNHLATYNAPQTALGLLARFEGAFEWPHRCADLDRPNLAGRRH
jgi:hypothetical protein